MKASPKESIAHSLKIIEEIAEKMELEFGVNKIIPYTNHILAHTESIRQELSKHFGE